MSLFLGYQTALRLAGQGAHVIMACRNPTKAEQAITQIKQTYVSHIVTALMYSCSVDHLSIFVALFVGAHSYLIHEKILRVQLQPEAKLECLLLDLASLRSVKAFAEEFIGRGLPLNILVCNAGVFGGPFRYLIIKHVFIVVILHERSECLSSITNPKT